MEKGLSSAEAAGRLKKLGFNELASAKPKNLWRIALEVVKEPMFLLLISCGFLYMMLGDYTEGLVLTSTIFIIILITFYQYQKTERALDALKKLSSPRASVIRDGLEIKIPGREVVPGDLIVLYEGDRIPADATLFEGINVTVDESLLTGESVPVLKTPRNHSNTEESNLYSGTLLVQGKGFARVMATGAQTRFGQIGASLQSIEQEETRLQKEMKVLIRNLFIAGVIISIGVVAAFYFSRGNFIQSLLNGLAASMAILPEEFPVVLSVFLALGVWRLSKKNVLTRKPSAIETLGSVTVLCSDKTGTITQNSMKVSALSTHLEVWHEQEFGVNKESIKPLLNAAYYASQHNSIDPMEKAIYAAYENWVHEKISHKNWVREYPLSKELLAMSRVYAEKEDHEFSVFCKGAPEVIFSMCQMSPEELSAQLEKVSRLAVQGYRIIAVAVASWQGNTLPENQKDFEFKYVGLVGFEDPIREEVPQAIRECQEAGIQVIMITGDYPVTAGSIAKQIGLSGDGAVITGSELNAMGDDELREKIKHVRVFARIVPEQKLQIIRALKANGEIVAMTGDGVNDAPALKAADIGIAMGGKGTDVAREASSLVLLDNNFISIVAAIRSGRRIYDNLKKAMSYILAIHVPIIGLTLLPAFFIALPLLLMPLHIVFMELIIDPICSVAFESEQEERGIMRRPPRDKNEPFFGWRNMAYSTFQGILLLIMVMGVYFLSINEGHSDGEVRAIAFSALLIGNLFLILTSLSKTRNFLSGLFENNIALMFIIVVAFTLLLLTLTVPWLQKIFNFEFPGFEHFVPSLIGASLMLLVLESVKYYQFRKASDALHTQS